MGIPQRVEVTVREANGSQKGVVLPVAEREDEVLVGETRGQERAFFGVVGEAQKDDQPF